MIGIFYTIICHPYNIKFFNQVEMVSHQISNIIFLFLYCFTDAVISKELKENIGILIILILGLYVCIMISIVSYYGF